MGRTWIIDVIADLQTFAQQNDLPTLADELAKVRSTALVELSSSRKDQAMTAWGEDTDTERLLLQAGDSQLTG